MAAIIRNRSRAYALGWSVSVLVISIIMALLYITVPGVSLAQTTDADAVQAPAPKLEIRRSTPQTSLSEVSRSVVCPTCDTTLDHAKSPAAERMRIWIDAAVKAGWTKKEIQDGLVAEYDGDESILAIPRAQGMGLLVWIIPGMIGLLAVVLAITFIRQWRRRDSEKGPGFDFEEFD